MGYESVKHVPRVSTYKHARKIYNEAVPIRGRAEEVRPLGRRKDADTYWCRMKKDGSEAIELVLYRTAVLTFKPNGDIVVQTNGYSTQSTHEFIGQVLLGVLCNGVRGNTVLSIRDKAAQQWVRHIVPKNESVTLRMVDGHITVPEPKGNYEYRLDRKAVKNLRIRYKDFYTYVDSMIKIRAVEQEPRKYSRYHAEEKLPPVVEFAYKEFADMLGFEAHLVTGQKRLKRTFVDIYKRKAELDFYISGDQPAEVRNDNFYAAFLGMAISEADYGWEDARVNYMSSEYDQPRRVRVSVIRERIDTQILRAHADEVLVWTRLAPDALPYGKYKHWLEDK